MTKEAAKAGDSKISKLKAEDFISDKNKNLNIKIKENNF